MAIPLRSYCRCIMMLISPKYLISLGLISVGLTLDCDTAIVFQDSATSGLSLASEAMANRDLGDPSMRLRLWDRSASLPAGYNLALVQNTVLARSCSSSSDSALGGQQAGGQLVQVLLKEVS